MRRTPLSFTHQHIITSALALNLSVFIPAWCASAEVQPVHTVTEWLPYVVKRPQKFSQLFDILKLPDDSAQALKILQDHNQPLDLNQLQTGQTIRVPRNWLRQETIPLKVTRIRCTGKAEPTTSTQQTLYPGMPIGEGKIIFVPGGCQVSLSLRDGSQLQLPSSSVVQIDTLRDQTDQKPPQVKLKLLQGKINLNVFKKRSDDTSLEVETPRATTGVRGTEFRVSHDQDSNTSSVEVLQGEVQTQAQGETQQEAIRANQGAVINGQGLIEIENLPEPPTLALQGQVWRWENIAPELQYRRQNLQSINESVGLAPPQATAGSDITAEGNNDQGTNNTHIVQAAAITPSGLMGAWATFVMCNFTATQSSHLCPIRFQVESINEQISHLDVRELNNPATTRWMSSRTRNTKTREVVALLPPGQYAWQIKNKSVFTSSTPNTEYTIDQGQFTVLSNTTRSVKP
jgi:hypothetical protein